MYFCWEEGRVWVTEKKGSCYLWKTSVNEAWVLGSRGLGRLGWWGVHCAIRGKAVAQRKDRLKGANSCVGEKTWIKGVRETDSWITCATEDVTMTWGFAVGWRSTRHMADTEFKGRHDRCGHGRERQWVQMDCVCSGLPALSSWARSQLADGPSDDLCQLGPGVERKRWAGRFTGCAQAAQGSNWLSLDSASSDLTVSVKVIKHRGKFCTQSRNHVNSGENHCSYIWKPVAGFHVEPVFLSHRWWVGTRD